MKFSRLRCLNFFGSLIIRSRNAPGPHYVVVDDVHLRLLSCRWRFHLAHRRVREVFASRRSGMRISNYYVVHRVFGDVQLRAETLQFLRSAAFVRGPGAWKHRRSFASKRSIVSCAELSLRMERVGSLL